MDERVIEAFLDLMDGVKEHDIARMTGLPPARCSEIYKLSVELRAAKEG